MMRSVKSLTVRLRSGEEVNIPVRGGDERVRDAWSLLTFLRRVTAKLEPSASSALKVRVFQSSINPQIKTG